jgi:hypothetical protein
MRVGSARPTRPLRRPRRNGVCLHQREIASREKGIIRRLHRLTPIYSDFSYSIVIRHSRFVICDHLCNRHYPPAAPKRYAKVGGSVFLRYFLYVRPASTGFAVSSEKIVRIFTCNETSKSNTSSCNVQLNDAVVVNPQQPKAPIEIGFAATKITRASQ